MTSEFRFDNARLLLADANGQVRTGLKSALFQQGFRNILDTGSYPAIHEAVERNCIDVMVVGADVAAGDVCDLTHRIRHHKIGNNPFLIVLMLTAAPTEELVRRIVDCGADDLIVKPFSPDTLISRLKTLARGRKPFVVTHDYIGPDRRKAARSGDMQKVPLIDVPNPLRSKAVANSDSASLQRLIDAAAGRINQQKMERYAVQIGYLTDRIVPRFENGSLGKPSGTLPEIMADLSRLSYVAEDLGFRMRGTAYVHVAELALSLIGVAQRIQESLMNPAAFTRGGSHVAGSIDHRDIELLPKIALALGRAFSPDKNTIEAAHAISSQVSAFGENR